MNYEDRLLALHDASTQGPWEKAEASSYKGGERTLTEYFVRRQDDDVAIAAEIIDPDTYQPHEGNAAFIPFAHNSAPLVAALVKAARFVDFVLAEGGNGEGWSLAEAAQQLEAALAALDAQEGA